MIKQLGFCLLGIAILTNGANAQSYLCVADQSTGFRYDASSKSWLNAKFKTDDKFLVKPSTEEGFKYEVSQFGLSAPLFSCRNEFNSVGTMACFGLFGEFRVNSKTLRFLSTYMVGYYTPNGDTNDNTPHIQIGTCTKM